MAQRIEHLTTDQKVGGSSPSVSAAERALKTLKAEGSLRSEVEAMQTRSRLYELLDYKSHESFDNSVFNFKLNKEQ